MSKEADWLAQFTGLDVATGAGTGEPDPAEQARAFADLQLRKQALLAEAHRELAQIKAEFQKAMTSEVTIKGKRQKEKMLEIEKTQASEAEFEEIDFGSIQLEKSTEAVIA